MNFKITKSPIRLLKKPSSKKEVSIVKYSIRDIVKIDILDISDIVTKFTFNCSESTDISESGWVSQQVFGLDFDGGFTHQELVQRLGDYNLIPNIIYATFSDDETDDKKRKFRVLFILDEPITDHPFARNIQKGLMNIFPESDKQCKDLCRMYYPGKKLLGLNDELNSREYFESCCLTALTKGSPRALERVNKSVYKTGSPILYNIGMPEKYTNLKTLNHFDWDNAYKSIRILDEFFNKDIRASYHILFGLASNLQFIKGGLLKMYDRMLEINKKGGATYLPAQGNRFEKYPEEYFSLVKTIRKWQYLPSMLETFSPYEEDHEHHNILEVDGLKRGEIVILKPQELIELRDAESVLQDSFRKALNSTPFNIEYDRFEHFDIISGETQSSVIPHAVTASIFNSGYIGDDTIYIFKVSTGIGKTRLIESLKNTLIAFPTHDLKEEVSGRMNITHQVTPRYATYSHQVINDKLDSFSKCDLFTEASDLIKSIALDRCLMNKQKLSLTADDIITAQEFIKQNASCRNTPDTVLTTHTRALYDEALKHDTIVFDEDPLNELLKIGSCGLDFSVFDKSDYEQFSKEVESFLRGTLGTSYVQTLPKFNIPRGFRQFCAIKKRGDIIQLLESKYVYKDPHDVTKVNYCRVKELPTNRTIFILSATIPVQIYQRLYGQRVKVIDISNIKHMGMIEQWTSRSFSMAGMMGKKRYSSKVYDEIFNIISGTPVITHLGAQKLFKNNWSKFYFGNCSGGDELNGQDISVIGTPNKPQYVYLFYAELMGLSNNNDFDLSDQIIEWNDFRFRFFTYRNEALRDIQLSLIESELLQACGRNRTLRRVCKTNVFSSLPLKITKKFNKI